MNFAQLSSKALAIVFTLTTFVLSWSFLWLGSGLSPGALAIILMWIPGLVSIAFRLGFREGFADAGFQAAGLRFWLLAFSVPLGMATATYILAWVFGLVELTPYLKQQSMFGPQPVRLVWFNPEAGTLGLLGQRLVVVMTLGIAQGSLFGLGEEIGWRGYLLPRLIQARVRFPILISGIIWAVWHMPFVLLTFQHQRYVTAALYALLCVVFAVFISWMRLASGSVFVAAMVHGAYNTFYQDFFDHSFAGPQKWFWAGEVGLLCSVLSGAVALWLYKTNRISPLLRNTHPGEEARTIGKGSPVTPIVNS